MHMDLPFQASMPSIDGRSPARMTPMTMRLALGRLAGACGAIAALVGGGAAVAAADPYTPLKLYQGRWLVRSSDGKTLRLENRCALTGLFFACEQAVDGKTVGLVVFAPSRSAAAGALTYRNRGLAANFSTGRPWGYLTIEGPHWVYFDTDPADGAHPARERTINEFTGADRIHFEVQTSTDGKVWTTTSSGEEQRAP